MYNILKCNDFTSLFEADKYNSKTSCLSYSPRTAVALNMYSLFINNTAATMFTGNLTHLPGFLSLFTMFTMANMFL